MDDPCKQYETVEERNLWLQQNSLSASELKESNNHSRLEQALKEQQESEQKYKHLIDFAPDAILIADAESGIILEANNSAATMLGLAVNQIVGMHQSQLHPAEDAQRYRELFQEHVQRKSLYVTEDVYVQHREGQKIPVQINTTVTHLGNKKVIYGIFRDVTQQKETERQLSDLAKFPSENSDPVLRISKDGVLMYSNQAGDKLLSEWAYEKESPVPNEWKKLIDEVCSSDKSKIFEIEHAQKIFSFDVTSIPQKKYLNLYVHDITAQKNLEQELQANEKKYRALYEYAQVPLYRNRLDDGKLLECNEALAALLGYDSREQCLTECYSTNHYANPDQRSELLARLKKEDSVHNYEVETIRRDGVHIWLEITAKLYPEEGYIEGVQFDITASKVLSKREQEILGLIIQGYSNKEIARNLDRSVRTIEDHRAHIMQKLNADNLVELIQKSASTKPLDDGNF